MRVFLSCCSLFFVMTLLAGPMTAAPLLPQGEAFGDSRQILKKSEDWQQQPVVHPADTSAEILINLDQSTQPFLADVIRQYAADHDLNLLIHSGTCGISNRGLLKKEIDMGSFCCPPGQDDRFPGIVFHTLGITALEIIVNQANPIRNLTFSQAQQIFSGDIDRWSDLVPPTAPFDYPIQPVAFIHCKKRPGHWRLLLDNEDLFSLRLQNVLTIPDIVSAVSGNKMAVSMAVSYLAHEVNRDRGEVRGVKIDNISPTDMEALIQGRYPLYRVSSVTYWRNGPHEKEIQKLIAFLDGYLEENSRHLLFVPASRLRKAGWTFSGEELVGAP
ncbi:MAG TPA: hypothetical protein ENJ30_06150 [Desulfobulbaceae bacterium]|nr:hypothetical protein [Desulfobulbaceae bacterium]